MSEKPTEKRGDAFVEIVIGGVCNYVADWK